MKLSVELEKWRADRPDEWKIDEFARNAEKIEAERDALAATVEALRVVLQCFHPENFEYLPDSFDLGDDVIEALAATPQQHLAEIRAQAGRDAADSLLRLADNFQTSSKEFENGVRMAAEYLKTQNADSIRRGEVE